MSKKETGVVHDTIVLTIITLVAGVVLGGVHEVTAGPIAATEKATQEAAEKEVFSTAASFEQVDSFDSDSFAETLTADGLDNTTVNAVYTALDDSGNKLGYVVDTTNGDGYGGDVQLMVGVTVGEDDLTINGISFLSLSETAGMGMKAKEPDFKDQFNNMDIGTEKQISYTKTGKSAANEIDAISGCTITTNAVTKAVNGALEAVESLEEGN